MQAVFRLPKKSTVDNFVDTGFLKDQPKRETACWRGRLSLNIGTTGKVSKRQCSRGSGAYSDCPSDCARQHDLEGRWHQRPGPLGLYQMGRLANAFPEELGQDGRGSLLTRKFELG